MDEETIFRNVKALGWGKWKEENQVTDSEQVEVFWNQSQGHTALLMEEEAPPPGSGSSRLWTRDGSQVTLKHQLAGICSPSTSVTVSAASNHCLPGLLNHFLFRHQFSLSLSLWLHPAHGHHKEESCFPCGTLYAQGSKAGPERGQEGWHLHKNEFA